VVGGLGYCALDKRRAPLSGDEQLGCWTDANLVAADGLFGDALSDQSLSARHSTG
jgi:hypothetical protein